MLERPVFDIEGKIRKFLGSTKEAEKGNPRFIEGEGSLKLQRLPLKVKEKTVIDDVSLEHHRRMTTK